jgi:hypothetical protein
MIALNDKGNILAAYYYLAKTNDGLKTIQKVKKKVDSMYNENGRITPDL